MKFLAHKQKGFTLIETLVAISILLIAVAAVFSAVRSSLSASSMLRDRVVATYFAEEGADAVKNFKDANLLHILAGDSVGWLNGISSCIEASPCGYDVLANGGEGSFSNCSSGNIDGCKVKTGVFGSDTTRVYRQMSASLNNPTTGDTGFVRKIWIEETFSGKEAKLSVEVTRPGTSFPPFKLVTFIYNYWPQ